MSWASAPGERFEVYGDQEIGVRRKIGSNINPSVALMFICHAMPSVASISYRDRAGCISTRTSTQGGVIMFRGHCIKSYSTTQGIIALSLGEAEFHGVVKAASIALGHRSM